MCIWFYMCINICMCMCICLCMYQELLCTHPECFIILFVSICWLCLAVPILAQGPDTPIISHLAAGQTPLLAHGSRYWPAFTCVKEVSPWNQMAVDPSTLQVGVTRCQWSPSKLFSKRIRWQHGYHDQKLQIFLLLPKSPCPAFRHSPKIAVRGNRSFTGA